VAHPLQFSAAMKITTTTMKKNSPSQTATTQAAGHTRVGVALQGAMILVLGGLCVGFAWQLANRPEHRHAAFDKAPAGHAADDDDAPARPEARRAQHDFVPRPPPLIAQPSAPPPGAAPDGRPTFVAPKEARRSFIAPVVSSGPAPNAKWVGDARGILEHLGSGVDTNGQPVELSKVQCFGGGCIADMVLDADTFNVVDEKLLSGGPFAEWHGIKQRSPLEQRPDGRIVTSWILLPPS
jgi:hypothetical protein